MKIKLLVDGGDMKPGPAIGQQLGPLGINIGQVISKVNLSTQEFKGIKVPVELDIAKNKNFEVKVFSPPTSELIKKELGIEKGSSKPQETKVGNISIEQIIKIAKIKQESMTASSFKAAVKSVVGSCVSLGIFIENKEPKLVEQEIETGNYDSEINSQKTDLSSSKKEKLEKFFHVVKERQEKLAQQAAAEAAEKAAAEEAAKPAAASAPEAKKEEAPKAAESKKLEVAKKK